MNEWNEFLSFRLLHVWPWIQISDISFPIGIFLDPAGMAALGLTLLITIGLFFIQKSKWKLNLAIMLSLCGLILSESFIIFIFFWVFLSLILHRQYKISIASLLGDLGLIVGFLFLYSESNGLTEFQSLVTWTTGDKFIGNWFFMPLSVVFPMTLWMAPIGKCAAMVIKPRRVDMPWISVFILISAYSSYRLYFELLSSFPLPLPILFAVAKIVVGTIVCVYGYRFLSHIVFLDRGLDLIQTHIESFVTNYLPFWMNLKNWKLPRFTVPYEKIETLIVDTQITDPYSYLVITMTFIVLGLLWVYTF